MEEWVKEYWIKALFGGVISAFGVMIAWCRNLDVPDKLYVYDFVGSENVDLEKLRKDIKELEDAYEIPRLF